MNNELGCSQGGGGRAVMLPGARAYSVDLIANVKWIIPLLSWFVIVSGIHMMFAYSNTTHDVKIKLVSTQLIIPNYLVTFPTDAAPQFLWNLPPLFICE